MNYLKTPLSLLSAAVVVVGAVLGRFDVALLGVILLIGCVAFLAIKGGASERSNDVLEDLGNEERAQLAPLRKLRNEIAAIVEAKQADVSISVVGREALAEADRLLVQGAKLVQARRELKKVAGGKQKADREIAQLEADLGAAAAEGERAALASALEARKLEASHYGEADSVLERLDRGLRQAEATLSEIKARLATASAGAVGGEHTSELDETLARLRSLGSSFDEAEQWLKGQS